MVKITTSDIKKVEFHIKQANVKYYEIYHEIYDHIYTKIENLINKNDITFEKAFEKVKKDGFSSQNINHINDEKIKYFHQENLKTLKSELKKCFRLPLLYISLLSLSIFFFTLQYFENPYKTATILIIFPYVFLIYYFVKYIKYYKKNGLIIMELDKFGTFFLPLIFVSSTLNLSSDYLISTQHNIFTIFILSVYIVFNFISIYVIHKLLCVNFKNTKKLYQI
jgi:hypothetical protein